MDFVLGVWSSPHLPVPYIFGTRGLVTWYIGHWELGSKYIGNWKMRVQVQFHDTSSVGVVHKITDFYSLVVEFQPMNEKNMRKSNWIISRNDRGENKNSLKPPSFYHWSLTKQWGKFPFSSRLNPLTHFFYDSNLPSLCFIWATENKKNGVPYFPWEILVV